MQQIVISGPSGIGKTTLATKITNPDTTLRLNAYLDHSLNIDDQIYQHLICRDQPVKALIIDGLNYGAMPTHIMQRIISKVIEAINGINQSSDHEMIQTIIWVGTRTTLVHLVNENLIYHVMNPRAPLTSFSIKAVDTINGIAVESVEKHSKGFMQVFDIATHNLEN